MTLFHGILLSVDCNRCAPLQHGRFQPSSSTPLFAGFKFRPNSNLQRSRALTARNVELACKTESEELNPQRFRNITARNADFNRRTVGSDEVDLCITLLQRCNEKNALAECKQVHAFALKWGVLEIDLVGNKLAILYAKNCCLEYARQVFDKISNRSVSAFAALIGSYCRLQRWEDVLVVLALMVDEGISPDKFLLPTVLKACSAVGSLQLGGMIQGYMIRRQLEFDIFVGNSLIDMYAKCGNLAYARQVFDKMPHRDVVSWTALVSAYAEAGHLDESVELFESMELSGIEPDLISWNSLISGFVQGGELDMALQLLDETKERGLKPGVNSWNGIISGCAQNGCFTDAVNLFQEMQSYENPNAVTISSILPACSGLMTLNLGKEIHCYAIKREFQQNLFVGGSMINMYLKCGNVDYAQRVFMSMENKNVTIWNTMIAAYADEGQMEEALVFLRGMEVDGVKPDVITYNTMLSGYTRNGQKDEAFKLLSDMSLIGSKPNIVSFNVLISGFQQSGLNHEALKVFQNMQLPKETNNKVDGDFLGRLLKMAIKPNPINIASSISACADLKLQLQGREIQGYILRNHFESNVIVSSALVDMYAKCGNMVYATQVFHRISGRSTVSWNILISAHNQNGNPQVALKLFIQMLLDGIQPSPITIIILLSACSNLAALMFGREIHCYAIKSRFHENVSVASSLIDMYAKCGSILEARMVFDNTVTRDLALWNSMISGYSIHVKAKDAFCLFEQMEKFGEKPDHITFTAVLSSCSHNGLVEQGWRYFNSMEQGYGITPSLEHYTCMVGIMGGAGLLDESLEFIKGMPFEPDSCMWATLLRACRVHSNLDVGEVAAKALFELEPRNASNYILLSNIYAMTGMWDSFKNVREAMRTRGLAMTKACSWIHTNHKLYAFEAGDSSNPDLEDILEVWDSLAREMEEVGYVPHDAVFIEEYWGEPDLFSCTHTEKLAICFGILSSPDSSPIRVVKNVRMCIDCHTSAKFISRIIERELLVRDGCFYHHFKDGICSCGDKW